MNKTPLIQKLGYALVKDLFQKWPKKADVWIFLKYSGCEESVSSWYGVDYGLVYSFNQTEQEIVGSFFTSIDEMLEQWKHDGVKVDEQLVITKHDLQVELDFYVSIDEARKLLIKMPDGAWFYDPIYKKFLNALCTLAWSEHLNRWIQWFHFDGAKERLFSTDLILDIANTLCVGDKTVLLKNDYTRSDMLFTVRECDIDQPYLALFRLAKDAECEAEAPIGAEKFDNYWYGQSEEDAIREHEAYQEELIQDAVQIRCGKNVKKTLLNYIDEVEVTVSHWPQWKKDQMK